MQIFESSHITLKDGDYKTLLLLDASDLKLGSKEDIPSTLTSFDFKGVSDGIFMASDLVIFRAIGPNGGEMTTVLKDRYA